MMETFIERYLGLLRPILDIQAVDLLEIAQIAGKQCGLAGKSNRCDLEIHRRQARVLLFEPLEFDRGRLIEVQDGQRTIQFHALAEAAVYLNLLSYLAGLFEFAHPTAHLFLNGYDRGRNFSLWKERELRI